MKLNFSKILSKNLATTKKPKTQTMSVQLTSASGYNPKKSIIFSECQKGSIPDSKPPINYRRINISTTYPDGSTGPLIVPTGECFSFGLSENLNMDTGKPNGYVVPLCLFNRDGPTKAEKEFVETFEAIIDACKDHILENKDEIEKYDLEPSELKKLNPLYYRREKGKIVEGTGPTLYAKVIISKKQGDKILTQFYDPSGEPLDPMTLLQKYCAVKAAIKFESIFIGNKISMQIKLYECEAKLLETGMPRLLARPKADNRVLAQTPNTNPLGDGDASDNDAGSVKDEEEEPEPEPEPVKKKVVRKVVKKKVAGQ